MEKNELSCAAIAGIFGVACLVGLFIWQLPRLSGDSSVWAAWVQAFGSIAAIAGAGWVARAQSREAAQSAADLRVQQLRAIAALVDQLFVAFSTTAQGLRNRVYTTELASYARLRTAPLKVAVATLETIPLHTLPNAYLGLPLANLKNMIHHGLAILSEIDRQDGAASYDGGAKVSVLVNTFNGHTDRAKEYLDLIWSITEAYNGRKSPVVLARDL